MVDVSSGQVKLDAKVRSGKEWAFTLDVVLPNGEPKHIGDGYVPLDANGRPESGPNFYLDKRVVADGLPSRIDFVRDGKPVPFTEYAITEANKLFERDFGHPPTELPGSLADDNREIFQRAYLAAIDDGMPADKAAVHAAENTPFVKNRRRLGFTDVHVTPSRTIDTIVYGMPPRLRQVPHGADIVARKP